MRSLISDETANIDMILTAVIAAIVFAISIAIVYAVLGGISYTTYDASLTGTPAANASDSLLTNLVNILPTWTYLHRGCSCRRY